MDNSNQVKNDLVTLITENNSVGVVVSGNQTTDILAAALSFHLIFQDSGKNSQAVSLTEPLVENSFLVGIDQLTKNFSGLTKTLTVSFPYKDGDIEKVSYNIEGDKLNVNLFAEEAGIRFSEKDIKYIRQGASPQTVFVMGVSQMSEIQSVLDQNAKIVNIDNTMGNGMYGQVNIVDPSYSSLSEVVARLARDLNLKIEFDVAQNLLDGITSATQNFTSPKTSSLAFEMAGFLMQKGAVRKNLSERQPSADTSLQALGKSFGPQPKPLHQPMDSFQNGQMSSASPKPASKPEPMPDMRSTSPQPFMSQPQVFNESQVKQRTQSHVMPNPQNNSDVSSDSIPDLPSEDEAPSDWFTPKVFKSNKPQQ